MKRTLTFAALVALMAAPAFSNHANPWANENDTVLSKNHESNQLKSIDTPGEDEMRGAMVQKARGKLENLDSSSVQGTDQSASSNEETLGNSGHRGGRGSNRN